MLVSFYSTEKISIRLLTGLSCSHKRLESDGGDLMKKTLANVAF